MLRRRGKSWQIGYTDPNGKWIRVSFKTKKEAEAELGKRKALIAEGRYLRFVEKKLQPKKTLRELYEEYRNKHQDRPYWRSKRIFLKRFLDHIGADTPLSEIGYEELNRYWTTLQTTLTEYKKTKRAPSTMNREFSAIRHMFALAYKLEWIDKNPFDRAKGDFLLEENNVRDDYLTKDEIDRLLNELKEDKDLHRRVAFALNTGMDYQDIQNLVVSPNHC